MTLMISAYNSVMFKKPFIKQKQKQDALYDNEARPLWRKFKNRK